MYCSLVKMQGGLCACFVLAVLLAAIHPAACQIGPGIPCDNIIPDQINRYDLTTLSNVSPLNITTNSTDDSGTTTFTTFRFSFCKALKDSCPFTQDPAIAQCGQPETAGVCQVTQVADLVRSSCDGKFENVMFETISDEFGSALVVSYHQGDVCADCAPKNVYSVINVYCDTTAVTPIIFSAERENPPTPKVVIRLRSIAGCPIALPAPVSPAPPPVSSTPVDTTPAGSPVAAQADGLSAGSVMLIILVVVSSTYLIVGILINKFVFHASGIELIPNINFWAQVPGLVRDGFRYATCRTGSVAEYRHV